MCEGYSEIACFSRDLSCQSKKGEVLISRGFCRRHVGGAGERQEVAVTEMRYSK